MEKEGLTRVGGARREVANLRENGSPGAVSARSARKMALKLFFSLCFTVLATSCGMRKKLEKFRYRQRKIR